MGDLKMQTIVEEAGSYLPVFPNPVRWWMKAGMQPGQEEGQQEEGEGDKNICILGNQMEIVKCILEKAKVESQDLGIAMPFIPTHQLNTTHTTPPITCMGPTCSKPPFFLSSGFCFVASGRRICEGVRVNLNYRFTFIDEEECPSTSQAAFSIDCDWIETGDRVDVEIRDLPSGGISTTHGVLCSTGLRRALLDMREGEAAVVLISDVADVVPQHCNKYTPKGVIRKYHLKILESKSVPTLTCVDDHYFPVEIPSPSSTSQKICPHSSLPSTSFLDGKANGGLCHEIPESSLPSPSSATSLLASSSLSAQLKEAFSSKSSSPLFLSGTTVGKDAAREVGPAIVVYRSSQYGRSSRDGLQRCEPLDLVEAAFTMFAVESMEEAEEDRKSVV